MADFKDLRLNEKLDNVPFLMGLLSTLSGPVIDVDLKENLRSTLEFVIVERREIFENIEEYIYSDDDRLEDLILPSVRRAWSYFHVNKPHLDELKLELFQLKWDVNDYLDYLIEMLSKDSVKKSLNDFVNIDRTAHLLEILVNNYVNRIIAECRKAFGDDLKKEIRDLKLKKILK